MQIYLVGGAVRDELLKLPVTEWDWVVVGASVTDMEKLGYKAVGKDFPVFLHPKTKDEYALARTERKTGPGYTGFQFNTDPSVTLEEDLRRRDLTINAMAQDADGHIIDPYGGRIDLAEGVLRHVSAAFVEDPVRVLRVARFLARFAQRGFSVATETYELMRQMVSNGELQHLVPERVWQEMSKALAEKHPAEFFAVLKDCGALTVIFPEIHGVFTTENMQSLQKAVLLSPHIAVRFAALMQFLPADLVEHRGKHFHVPNDILDLAILAATFRTTYHHAATATADELLTFFNGVDLWRKPRRFEALLMALSADIHVHNAEEINNLLRATADAALMVDHKRLQAEGFSGKALGDAIDAKRLQAIATMIA